MANSMIGNTGMQPPRQSLRGYDVGSVQNYNPQQMELFQNSFSSVSPGSYTSRLAQGDPSLYRDIEAKDLRGFSELQGNLASRFSGMGSLGARRSSGFQNTANRAAMDFAQELSARRLGLQRQAVQDLHSMSQDLLSNRPTEQFVTDKKKSWWDKLISGATELAPLIGGAVGALSPIPGGAAAGFGLGQKLAKWGQ